MARPYDQYPITYAAAPAPEHSPIGTTTPVSAAEYQQLIAQNYPAPYAQQYEYQQQQQQQHAAAQVATQEAVYAMDQSQLQQQQQQQQQQQHMQRQMSVSASHYSNVSYDTAGRSMSYPTIQTNVNPRKRSYQEDTSPYDTEYQGIQQAAHYAAAEQLTSPGSHPQLQASYGYPVPSHRGSPIHQHPQHNLYMAATHHHHMPNRSSAAKYPRLGGGVDEEPGPASVVGQPGMPEPAPKPKGPKLKFTSDDDSLLVGLKEQKNLTWKQIADFFPGRSSGTLQVRYCTKLKAKTTVWTDDMVNKLRAAMAEYENDRWRLIASKVGNGFSAMHCEQKAQELDEEDECETIVNHSSDAAAAAAASSQASVDGDHSPRSQAGRRDTAISTSFQLNDSTGPYMTKSQQPIPIPVSGVSVSTPPAAVSYHRETEGFTTTPQHHHHSLHHSSASSPITPYTYPAPPMPARFDVMVSS